ncbi:MAG: hypothetical protein P8046_08470 [Anaerolineales bacterium]
MKKMNLFKLLVIAGGGIVLSVIAIFAADWLSLSEAKAEIFRIFQLEGNVQRYQPVEKKFIVAEDNMGIKLGEQLLTDEHSWARVQFFNSGSSMHVDPLSSVAFQNEGLQEGLQYAKLRVDIGNVYVVSAGNLMVVETPQGIVYADEPNGVFHVRVNLQEAETVVVCLDGDCAVMNDTGLTELASGEMAKLRSKQAAPLVERMDQGTLADNVEVEIQNTAEELVQEADHMERKVIVHSTIIDGLSSSLNVRAGNGSLRLQVLPSIRPINQPKTRRLFLQKIRPRYQPASRRRIRLRPLLLCQPQPLPHSQLPHPQQCPPKVRETRMS